MNRTITNKNKPSHKVIIFWSIIALLTLSFIGLVIYRFISTREDNLSDNLINLSDEQVLSKEGTYYLYVYSRIGVTDEKLELDKADELETSINKYITYVKKHSNANKIYGMVVDSGSGNYGNYSRLVDGDINTSVKGATKFDELLIHKEDIPILMKIENGKVAQAYLTANSIRAELDQAMGL